MGGGITLSQSINLHREDGSHYTNISQLLIVVNILIFFKIQFPLKITCKTGQVSRCRHSDVNFSQQNASYKTLSLIKHGFQQSNTILRDGYSDEFSRICLTLLVLFIVYMYVTNILFYLVISNSGYTTDNIYHKNYHRNSRSVDTAHHLKIQIVYISVLLYILREPNKCSLSIEFDRLLKKKKIQATLALSS